MAKWGEVKCPRCAAPPISLWEGMVRQLEESDAREARLEAKLAKALAFLEFLDGNYRHAFGDTARAKIRALHAELTGDTL